MQGLGLAERAYETADAPPTPLAIFAMERIWICAPGHDEELHVVHEASTHLGAVSVYRQKGRRGGPFALSGHLRRVETAGSHGDSLWAGSAT
jgi:hypothetical protein